MSACQALLDRIAALRLDTESSRSPEKPPPTAPPATPAGGRLAALQRQVASGSRQDAVTERLVRLAAEPSAPAEEEATLPRQLTGRSRRLLERGRGLLDALRGFAEQPPVRDEAHPLNGLYAEAAAMAEVAVRTLQGLPDSAAAQLRLCAGLEGILDVVAERVTRLEGALARIRQERMHLQTLADLLVGLHAHGRLDAEAFGALAEAVLDEARRGEPLRFLDPEGEDPSFVLACHALTAARVAVRLARADAALRAQAAGVAAAALVQDVGMLAVAPEVLTLRHPLGEAERRAVERHARASAEILGHYNAELAQAVGSHHERLDGTGYPAGLRGSEIPALARLLAVADTYTALACARPHRAALDARAALAETARQAERGRLDPAFTALLLDLGFYPAGTAVELADGCLGLVLATHPARADARTLAQPVVTVLVGADGRPLPEARHVDLARAEDAVAHGLTAGERRARLGPWLPEWAW